MARHLSPMLAISNTGSSGRNPIDVRILLGAGGGWYADTKLDGMRAWLMDDGRILNRKGEDVTATFPEIHNPTGEWLDVEIMALDGNFETILRREGLVDNGKRRRAASNDPCTFVAFDVPALYEQSWMDRRHHLDRLALHHDFQTTPCSGGTYLLDKTLEQGMEGVIAKRTNSRYQFGKRSADWVKHKHVKRISCIAYGYEPGNGSRAHFGAMLIALIQDGKVVPVGKTGSGFTDAMTHCLKARLDSGESFPVEIEFLNVTSGGTLRFPVFRGVRTDVAITDCTYDQITPTTTQGES